MTVSTASSCSPTAHHVRRYALISVSQKEGLLPLAQCLHASGIHILSTGGTAKWLEQHDIPLTHVEDVTGFPEIMDGRVKTLHPSIHAGLLARKDLDDATLRTHNIKPIDFLIVNLYPFQQTIEDPTQTLDNAIDNIDIGGPAMLRAGAKNYDRVSVVVDPADYPILISAIAKTGETDKEQRHLLAQKAFAHCARYDTLITNYLGQNQSHDTFPKLLQQSFCRQAILRYGENPQQKAALYRNNNTTSSPLLNAHQLQGKALSYNNIADVDAALRCVQAFPECAACVIVKHTDPCGVGISNTLATAYQHAFATDPSSSFGGVIACNRPLDEKTAQTILDQQFVEVIVAPEVGTQAQTILKQKPRVRVLRYHIDSNTNQHTTPWHIKSIEGGLLVQEQDDCVIMANDLNIVSERSPTSQELTDLIFAWKVVQHVRSNAVVFAYNERLLSIGGGQTNRADSVRVAIMKAQAHAHNLNHSVMASDAFFPFADGIEQAAKANIRAIIQPGGSIRDNEVIAAANKAGIAMVFTGQRHFRH